MPGQPKVQNRLRVKPTCRPGPMLGGYESEHTAHLSGALVKAMSRARAHTARILPVDLPLGMCSKRDRWMLPLLCPSLHDACLASAVEVVRRCRSLTCLSESVEDKRVLTALAPTSPLMATEYHAVFTACYLRDWGSD